jgi:predicted acyltransferase
VKAPNADGGGAANSKSVGQEPSRRLLSLDALRGFDMFWILGGESLAHALGKMGGGGSFTHGLSEQLQHVEWAGFRFYDLIFPLFVFIVGVSLAFSLGRTIDQHGEKEALKRVFRRSILLYLIGIFYSGGFGKFWPDIRLLGVLNRIALCYFFASLIYIAARRSPRAIAGACAALLVGYWALMSFVPFPDVRPVDANGGVLNPELEELKASRVAELNLASTNRVVGLFAPGRNLANYVDQKYLPGKKWDGTWDPEGLLSTLPAVGSCLLGVLAGIFLLNPAVDDRRKVRWLAAGGAVAVLAGFAWSVQFPIIKKIWTSSFVLVAGGFSALLLALFYWVIDVRQWQRWCVPFVWIGMNPITLYLGDNLLRYREVSGRFFGGDIKAFLEMRLAPGAGEMLIALGEIGIALLLAWFLYRRRIFLRL